MASASQVQLRGDTAANVAAYTGPVKEVVVDTTNKRLVLQDGSTAGGIPHAKLSEVQRIGRTALASGVATYQVLATDVLVALTGSTGGAVLTLPSAAAYPVGQVLTIQDETGQIGTSKVLTLAASGTDTIEGQSTFAVTSPFSTIQVYSNGATWFNIVDNGTGSSVSTSTTYNLTTVQGGGGGLTAGSAVSFSGSVNIASSQAVSFFSVRDKRIKATSVLFACALSPLVKRTGVVYDVFPIAIYPGGFDAVLTAAGVDSSPSKSTPPAVVTINYLGV